MKLYPLREPFSNREAIDLRTLRVRGDSEPNRTRACLPRLRRRQGARGDALCAPRMRSRWSRAANPKISFFCVAPPRPPAARRKEEKEIFGFAAAASLLQKG